MRICHRLHGRQNQTQQAQRLGKIRKNAVAKLNGALQTKLTVKAKQPQHRERGGSLQLNPHSARSKSKAMAAAMRRDFRRHSGAIYHRSQAHVCVCVRECECIYVCVWVYATTKPVHRRQTTATGLGLATDTGERADYLILFLFLFFFFFGVKNFYLASVESCRRVSWRRRRNDISVLAHTHTRTHFYPF